MGNVLADSDPRASATMAEAEPHPRPPAKRARLAPAPAPRPDRILVPQEQEQQEQQQQPGQAHEGFRVTAAEFDGLQTLVEMAEHEPGAVRFSINVSESDLRAAIELLRGGTGFIAETDPGVLARAVAACDFLGATTLPGAAAVCARLLPGADPAAAATKAAASEARAVAARAEVDELAVKARAAEARAVAARTEADKLAAEAAEETQSAFHAVMEQTTYGPALWATVPLEEVGRLAGAVGQAEGDDRGKAVAGMARAELARRILALPDLELAMLRAHAAATVAGPARAELLRRHPQLTPMTTDSLRVAVQLFCEEDGGRWAPESANFRHSPNAAAQYGPIALWDVSGVRSMYSLFERCTNFNEDISAWDVRNAENLVRMFAGASSFNQPLGAWDIRRAPKIPVARTTGKFHGATAFGRAANAPKRT